MQNRWIWTFYRNLTSKIEVGEVFSSDVRRLSYLLYFRENLNKFPRIFRQTSPTTSLAVAIKWTQLPESLRQPYYGQAKKIVAENLTKKVNGLPFAESSMKRVSRLPLRNEILTVLNELNDENLKNNFDDELERFEDFRNVEVCA